MRNAIQHLEKDIQKGKIIEGQSLALNPTPDSIQLGPLTIKYIELADWITEAYELSGVLAGYRER
ncbi:MAG: hypothetical protein OHK0012_23630 [Synechococcales cyanobacterium]